MLGSWVSHCCFHGSMVYFLSEQKRNYMATDMFVFSMCRSKESTLKDYSFYLKAQRALRSWLWLKRKEW